MGSRVKFVQCPDGELQKRMEVMHCVSLHEIDVINSRTQGFLALFTGDTGEIRAEVRDQIDTKVAEWREEGKAEIMPGAVFVGTGETAEISTQFGNFDVLPDVTTDHHFLITKEIPQLSDQTSLIIMKEWNNLSKNLPESIYVRVYGTRIDLLRDVIIGPSGTPYHDGLFFFDISLPADYPLQLPKVYYHAHGYSLNPNLYENGMVCLSLINTWPADKESKWRTKSTILQLLVSLQGLVLNERPLFNEPIIGMGRNSSWVVWMHASNSYNERVFIASCNTMFRIRKKPPQGFEDFVVKHFRARSASILAAIDAYEEGLVVCGQFQVDGQCSSSSSSSVLKGSATFMANLRRILPRLEKAFGELTFSQTAVIEKRDEVEGGFWDIWNNIMSSFLVCVNPNERELDI